MQSIHPERSASGPAGELQVETTILFRITGEPWSIYIDRARVAGRFGTRVDAALAIIDHDTGRRPFAFEGAPPMPSPMYTPPIRPVFADERSDRYRAALAIVVILAGVIALIVAALGAVRADVADEALPDVFDRLTAAARMERREYVTPCPPPKAGETLVARHSDGGPLACAYVRNPARLDATL